jgi:predicted RNA binding protein YcfA (HicA-like mRNA interferase family)
MRTRKSKEIISALERKGFELNPDKDSHKFYYLVRGGKKTTIYTFISHGNKEYDKNLMSIVKRQLKFRENQKMEDFFDCPMTGDDYVRMLEENGEL